eukprot:PhM_4_TR11390/c0_g1_i2/m.84240
MPLWVEQNRRPLPVLLERLDLPHRRAHAGLGDQLARDAVHRLEGVLLKLLNVRSEDLTDLCLRDAEVVQLVHVLRVVVAVVVREAADALSHAPAVELDAEPRQQLLDHAHGTTVEVAVVHIDETLGGVRGEGVERTLCAGPEEAEHLRAHADQLTVQWRAVRMHNLVLHQRAARRRDALVEGTVRPHNLGLREGRQHLRQVAHRQRGVDHPRHRQVRVAESVTHNLDGTLERVDLEVDELRELPHVAVHAEESEHLRLERVHVRHHLWGVDALFRVVLEAKQPAPRHALGLEKLQMQVVLSPLRV